MKEQSVTAKNNIQPGPLFTSPRGLSSSHVTKGSSELNPIKVCKYDGLEKYWEDIYVVYFSGPKQVSWNTPAFRADSLRILKKWKFHKQSPIFRDTLRINSDRNSLLQRTGSRDDRFGALYHHLCFLGCADCNYWHRWITHKHLKKRICRGNFWEHFGTNTFIKNVMNVSSCGIRLTAIAAQSMSFSLGLQQSEDWSGVWRRYH